MLTASLRRKTLLLLLVAVLLTPWASAASLQTIGPRPPHAVESHVPDFFSRIWSFLRNAGSKAGCRIDPNGLCADSPAQNPPPVTKEGCRIDPDGRCLY